MCVIRVYAVYAVYCIRTPRIFYFFCEGMGVAARRSGGRVRDTTRSRLSRPFGPGPVPLINQSIFRFHRRLLPATGVTLLIAFDLVTPIVISKPCVCPVPTRNGQRRGGASIW